MKTVAFSTMVDIAEKEFNVPIRKKYNTKPSNIRLPINNLKTPCGAACFVLII